ncbi:MAG: DUF664 domain-containing protein [Ilumatobacteraceae bacterium]
MNDPTPTPTPTATPTPTPSATATSSQRILLDCFARVSDVVHDTLEGIDRVDLVARISPNSNSIAWLIWHLSRVQDDHIATLAARDQVWVTDGWDQRFGLPFPPAAIGYGHSTDEVAAVRSTVSQLIGYFESVHQATASYVATITDEALEHVIDHSYDPPVAVEVRIVSVISDCLQHAGQAAFNRGLLDPAWHNGDG